MSAVLVLADGTKFRGISIGAPGLTAGEVVHIGRVIRGTGKFELKRKRNRTVFHWQEELIAPTYVLIFMKPLLLLGVWLSLHRFARQLSA